MFMEEVRMNSRSSTTERRPGRRAALLVSLVVVSMGLVECSIGPIGAIGRLPITSKGIVVPKRPAIIAGLEHSFRGRHASAGQNSTTTSDSGSNNSKVSILGSLTGSRTQQQTNKKQPSNGPQQQILYLNKRQQELLAANPNYAETAAQLTKRSDSSQTDGTAQGAHLEKEQQQSLVVQQLLSQSSQQQASVGRSPAVAETGNAIVVEAPTTGRDSLYKGYSLIELEVRSEQDRHYVQDLYANLSAALNEQASKPQTLTVSPYADIDFWSFKNGVNDQVDIMVSPKSRQFILNQLSRAKIRHRIKIDDIQSRLEQQVGSSNHQSSPQANDHSFQLSGRQSPTDLSNGTQAELSAENQEKLAGRQDMHGQNFLVNDSMFFDNYQRLGDINQYMESLVGRARDVARVQVIGRSSQGRYLRVLRLGYEQKDADGSTLDESVLSGMSSGLPDRSGSSSPASQNASMIVDQFMLRHQSVRKLGSIWLDGGTHAREWISPATVLYIAFRLTDNHARCQRFFDHLHQIVQQGGLSNVDLTARHGPGELLLDSDLISGINDINSSLMPYSSNGGSSSARQRPRSELEQKLELLSKRPQEVASEHGCDLELEQLLRRYTFYMEPVLNPDGYEYSHTHNRLWRKTRSTSNHPIYRHFCLGADPNRNYDARHGSTGSSSHPCSQTFGGSTPFTEPETRHQSNFVYSHRSNMKMYISFHSYSQMILLPYSHSKHLAPDHKDLESVGQAGVKAIERTHGTQYRVGASASILYTASGTASDWAYEKAGIKYSYTIELRDTGAFGFLLPKQQIIPTGEETFNGLLAMIAQMEKNDNLLTSKSSYTNSLTGLSATNGTLSSGANSGEPLIHAPDLDQLRPFGRFRPKPAQLENAIDGSDTWATPEPRPPGVRDRKPVSNSIDETLQAHRASSSDELTSAHILEEETISTNDMEPDAGLAFEGEGDLMEPSEGSKAELYAAVSRGDHNGQTANGRGANILSSSELMAAAKQVNEQAVLNTRSMSLVAERLRKRNDNNRQTMTLSSNGRSLINNPIQGTRTTRLPSRRESSEPTKDGNLLVLHK